MAWITKVLKTHAGTVNKCHQGHLFEVGRELHSFSVPQWGSRVLLFNPFNASDSGQWITVIHLCSWEAGTTLAITQRRDTLLLPKWPACFSTRFERTVMSKTTVHSSSEGAKTTILKGWTACRLNRCIPDHHQKSSFTDSLWKWITGCWISCNFSCKLCFQTDSEGDLSKLNWPCTGTSIF